MEEHCVTCKKAVSLGAARFKCPKCGKYDMVRCRSCREIAAKYTCPGCNFTGPN